ncbi:hypothetical protein QQ045_006218 [Rhodiola kirilowii]
MERRGNKVAKEVAHTSSQQENPDELEHVTVAKALLTVKIISHNCDDVYGVHQIVVVFIT